MQFNTIFVLASVAAVMAAPAAPVAPAAPAEIIESRQAITGAITTAVTSVVTDVVSDLTVKGINKAGGLIKALTNWTAAREQFTKDTTKAMWDGQADKNKYPAAICYNMAYTAPGAVGKAKANLKSSALKTDYDCFFLPAGATFKYTGDGGYINLAIQSNSAKCKFDNKAKTVVCSK